MKKSPARRVATVLGVAALMFMSPAGPGLGDPPPSSLPNGQYLGREAPEGGVAQPDVYRFGFCGNYLHKEGVVEASCSRYGTYNSTGYCGGLGQTCCDGGGLTI